MSESMKTESPVTVIPETRLTFPRKLLDAVNDHQDLIKWSPDGLRIMINEKRFENEVSSAYPGLVQIRSFVNFRRQLREYNFAWAVGNRNDFEFCHPLFRRDQPEMVESILTRRKSKQIGIMPEAYAELESPLPIGRKRKRRSSTKERQSDELQDQFTAKKRDCEKATTLPRASKPFLSVSDQSSTELDLQSAMARDEEIQTQLDSSLMYYHGGAGDTSTNTTTQIIGHTDTVKDTHADSCLQLGCNGRCGYNTYRLNSSAVPGPPLVADVTPSYPATIPYYPHDSMAPRYLCTQACGMPRAGMLQKGNWAPYGGPNIHRTNLPPFPEQFRSRSSVSAATTVSSSAPVATETHSPSSISDTALYDHNAAFNDEHSRALYNQGYIPVMYTWIPGNHQPHATGDPGTTSYPEIDDLGIDTRSPLPLDDNNNSATIQTATPKLQAIDTYCQTSPLVLD